MVKKTVRAVGSVAKSKGESPNVGAPRLPKRLEMLVNEFYSDDGRQVAELVPEIVEAIIALGNNGKALSEVLLSNIMLSPKVLRGRIALHELNPEIISGARARKLIIESAGPTRDEEPLVGMMLDAFIEISGGSVPVEKFADTAHLILRHKVRAKKRVEPHEENNARGRRSRAKKSLD